MLGNSFDISQPWAAELREILGPPAIERPRHWPPAETLRERFAEVEDRRFAHAQLLDLAHLRDLAVSRSSLAIKDPGARELTLGRVDELWQRHPELAGRREAELRWVARVRRCRTLL